MRAAVRGESEKRGPTASTPASHARPGVSGASIRFAAQATVRSSAMDGDSLVSQLLLEFRCGTCGYGVRVRQAPEACSMCHTSRWKQQDPGPAPPHFDELAPEHAPRELIPS
jgi:hypothetical protein